MFSISSNEEMLNQHKQHSTAAAVVLKLWQRRICLEHAQKNYHVTANTVESAFFLNLASCTSSELSTIEAKEWIALESMVSSVDEKLVILESYFFSFSVIIRR